jgi:hypothetical protein
MRLLTNLILRRAKASLSTALERFAYELQASSLSLVCPGLVRFLEDTRLAL